MQAQHGLAVVRRPCDVNTADAGLTFQQILKSTNAGVRGVGRFRKEKIEIEPKFGGHTLQRVQAL